MDVFNCYITAKLRSSMDTCSISSFSLINCLTLFSHWFFPLFADQEYPMHPTVLGLGLEFVLGLEIGVRDEG